MNKKIHNILTILVTIVMSFGFVSCSDDDNSLSNSFIVVNGEECKIDGEGQCSFHGTISDESGDIVIPPHAGFTLSLNYDESFYYFEFNIDDLNSPDIINENFVLDGKVSVGGFRRYSVIELSTDYYGENGSLSISEKGTNYVVVNFDNFSFIKDTGNREIKYTINGKVKYVDINK